MGSNGNNEISGIVVDQDFCDVLSRGNVKECYGKILALENRGDQSALNILMDNLSNRNWLVRKMAAEAIFNCGPWVVNRLKEGLFSDVDHIAYWSIQILKRFKRKGHQMLLESLHEVPYTTCYEIVRALGEVKYGPAIDSLVALFSNPSWELRREAGESLIRIGKKAVPALKVTIREDTLEIVDTDTCFWNLRTTARILGGGAVPYLRRFAEAEDERLRLCAVMALGETRDIAALEPLKSCFDHDSLAVREQAAEALERLRNSLGETMPEETEPCRAAETRTRSFQVLSSTLDESTVESLSNVVITGTSDMRIVAISALSQIASPEAVQLCASLFNGDTWIVRSKAADSLKTMGQAAVPHLSGLVETGNDSEKYWSIRVLADIRGEDAIRPLFQVLREDPVKWKIVVLNALEDSREPLLIEALSHLLGDSNWSIRKRAANLISRFGPEIIEPMITINAARDEGIDDVVYWAARVVHNLSKRGETELMRVMENPDNKVKRLALSVMCALFTPAFRDAIVDYLMSQGEKAIEMVASTVTMNGDATVVSELLARLGTTDHYRTMESLAAALRGSDKGDTNQGLLISVDTAKQLVENYYNSGSAQYFEKLVEFFLLVEDRELLHELLNFLKADVNRFVGFIISIVSDARMCARCRYFIAKIVTMDREFYKILKNILDDMVAARDFMRLEQLLAWDDPATAVFSRILADNHRGEVTTFLMEVFRKMADRGPANEILMAICRKLARADRTVRTMVRAMLHGREEEYLPIIVKAVITESNEDFFKAAVDFLKDLGVRRLPEDRLVKLFSPLHPDVAAIISRLSTVLSETGLHEHESSMEPGISNRA
ncbi:MAG: hypothetical protein CVV64_19900 [Candidatus Wallbacteria bacterium HGW-Wallbacteria-1]|jgi:HEAT repeat protein|uniref:HEAT repeat domain-containing protein n=1 Tax=Candidatus Wallbacteria bacterium HGW-Wallbacteria-1 TaxID=2013854 RepID=A0A2N1PIM6_9BACT|nr:MAG: hypothetical protein CVV64_19900 [Candidatus Wallbacteria bacterium HGW-Wallbacteria-1]